MEGADLIISISQYGKNYRLQWPAQDQVPGKMTGEWIKLSPEGELTGWKGQLKGTLVSEKWLTKMSNGLRPISSAGSVTSADAVFRAWANPH